MLFCLISSKKVKELLSKVSIIKITWQKITGIGLEKLFESPWEVLKYFPSKTVAILRMASKCGPMHPRELNQGQGQGTHVNIATCTNINGNTSSRLVMSKSPDLTASAEHLQQEINIGIL